MSTSNRRKPVAVQRIVRNVAADDIGAAKSFYRDPFGQLLNVLSHR